MNKSNKHKHYYCLCVGSSVAHWSHAGLLINRLSDRSCTKGMIHNNKHLISPGCPRPSIASESWPKTPVILFRCLCVSGGFCPSSPCRHGGTCKECANGYVCFCPEGFMGIHCERGGTAAPRVHYVTGIERIVVKGFSTLCFKALTHYVKGIWHIMLTGIWHIMLTGI